MLKYISKGGIRVVSPLLALMAASFFMTGCGETTHHNGIDENSGKVDVLPPNSGIEGEVITEQPIPHQPFQFLNLMVRTDIADPHNEQGLDAWRFQIVSIDDQARPTSPIYYGETGPDGNGLVPLPPHMTGLPLLVTAYNDVLPPIDLDDDPDDLGECRYYEIFIPANCYSETPWLVGPVESALWNYYKKAAMRRAEAWNPSQVDCGTWLANLQGLILTDEVADELHELSDRDVMLFDDFALFKALQENQEFLTATRPPICMAERRHNGGGMERGEEIDPEGDFVLDDIVPPFTDIVSVMPDDDPVTVDLATGLPEVICTEGLWEDQALSVNGSIIAPEAHYLLDDEDFMGTVHDDKLTFPDLQVTTYNVRLGNGRELDHDKYDDSCALTNAVEFTNKLDDEQDINIGSGITYSNLFNGNDTVVYTTSDGDAVVDDNDTWAIFYDAESPVMEERVLLVEFLGHRREDWRDNLHMRYDTATEDLFLGVRSTYELNEEPVDGEKAFMFHTVSVWDGSSFAGRRDVRQNIFNCYEAADPWMRQYFITKHFQIREEEWCIDDECQLESLIKPLEAAEFAARSQCHSNSRANQRWRTDESGYWSINTDHGVHANIVVNPGWLAPDLDFEIYIQRFDEAVFKGPRTIARTDDCGQLSVALPTLVEGDRVLIKSEDNCCDDYDLVLPCVPEFTGYAGVPGIPYVPPVQGPPPVVGAGGPTGIPLVPAATGAPVPVL